MQRHRFWLGVSVGMALMGGTWFVHTRLQPAATAVVGPIVKPVPVSVNVAAREFQPHRFEPLPEGWGEFQFNGQPVYVIPLDSTPESRQ